MTIVCHLTSAHPRFDTRIFHKECRSVASSGLQAILIVADGKDCSEVGGVRVIGIHKQATRWRRMWSTPRQLLSKALRVDADIYHIHDPELLTIALRLKRAGKKVIFDSHEDVPRQILSKHYILKPLRSMVSKLFSIYEAFVCSRLDAVVAATPIIRDKFLRINPRTIDVNNFPLLSESGDGIDPGVLKRPAVCYIGGISAVRGIRELVEALPLTTNNARLLLAGKFTEEHVSLEVRALPGWSQVDELGWLDRADVGNVMRSSIAGMVTLHPTLAYLDSLPVKMFEYMNSGLPVIASDFPLWRGIIDEAGCGICVNPLDPHSVAAAIDWVVAHPDEAAQMGENGRRAVRERYNWAAEEKKLLALYESLA